MFPGGKTAIFWAITVILFAAPFVFYWTQEPLEPNNTTPLQPMISQGISVHVSGALDSPGVYHVKMGTPLHALVNALTLPADADVSHLNLAKPCRDGQKIVIKTQKKIPQFININLASQDELLTLPGVGQQTVKKIILYQSKHGHVANIRELARIIGKKKATSLQNKIVF
jgi:competence protein ComEA